MKLFAAALLASIVLSSAPAHAQKGRQTAFECTSGRSVRVTVVEDSSKSKDDIFIKIKGKEYSFSDRVSYQNGELVYWAPGYKLRIGFHPNDGVGDELLGILEVSLDKFGLRCYKIELPAWR